MFMTTQKAIAAPSGARIAPVLAGAAKSSANSDNNTLLRKALKLASIQRARNVDVDFRALEELTPDAQDTSASRTMRVHFFDDASMLIEINRTEPTASGGIAYVGKVAGEKNSLAVFVNNAGTLSLNVFTAGDRYALHGSRETGFLATQKSRSDLPDHPRITPATAFEKATGITNSQSATAKPTPLPSTSQKSGSPSQSKNVVDDGSTIDVMVVYTVAAKLAQTPGTAAQMHANIDAQIAITNAIYANSNVVQRLRLVYRGEVDFVEANTAADLTKLVNTVDGYLDDVPLLRELYGADLVSLWGVYSDACGLSSIMYTEDPVFASLGYNVVNSPLCTGAGDYSYAHELGHNMGLLHDTYADPTASTTVTPEGSGTSSSVTYAHGYVDFTNRFRSVMATFAQCLASSVSCLRIPYFSNPAVSFDNNAFYAPATSAPTGNASTAHEARALNDTRETVANFRAGLSSFNGPGVIALLPRSYAVSENTGTVQLSVGRHVGSTGAVSVNYTTVDGTALAGSDFTAVNGTLTWADGDSSVQTISVPILQDAIFEGNESFTVLLDGATGGASVETSGGTTASATITIIEDEEPGVLVFVPVTPVTVAEAGSSVQLSIARTLGSVGVIAVNYAAISGTAISGQDFATTSGTLSWADGDASEKIITVPILLDALLEGTESFTVVLSGATGGASIGSKGGTSTARTINITDDEADFFPAGGVIAANYVTPAASPGAWTVEPSDGNLSPSSLRSAQTVGAGSASDSNTWNFVNSDLEYAGTFQAGNVDFAYKVSSYMQTGQSFVYGELEFWIDSQLMFSSGGGEIGWSTTSIPVAAGAHTLRWRFKNRLPQTCATRVPAPPGGGNCADRAWIDSVSLPLAGATLSILKSSTDTGTGTVTGNGINCGADCQETVVAGTMITLTANPTNGSIFAGWSGGGCVGAGTCVVTMHASQNVTARFDDPFPVDCAIPAAWSTPATATAGWSPATDRARSGKCSLKSNPIPDNGRAEIKLTGNFLAGTLSFYYNVSSEGGYDCLRFFVDADQRAEMGNCFGNSGSGASGNISTWTLVQIPISAGARTFRWSYEKDSSSSDGADTAWIDDVVLPAPSLVLNAVYSRKTHAGLGPFDIDVDKSAKINEPVTIEPRAPGAGHSVVFRFNGTVTSVGTVSAFDTLLASVTIASTNVSGNEVTVTLSNVADRQRVTVSLTGVNGTTTVDASLGFLLGDVNDSRVVDGTDTGKVKARSGQTVNQSNARYDVNVSGVVGAADIAAVKARSGRVLQ